jgi:uncharacterized protein YaiL (DUF2058 family)
MANSLQEQLLKAGLVKQQQLRHHNTKKRKQKQQVQAAEREIKEQTHAQQVAKQAHDRALNHQQQAQAQQKADRTALRQLIHEHRLTRDGADIAYNFIDGKTLKRLYVTAVQQEAIRHGQIAIVRQDHFYELIQADMVARIYERDPTVVVVWNQGNDQAQTAVEDDYAAYPVPDDLMW